MNGELNSDWVSISCRGVSKRYGKSEHLALHPSDLEIGKGEFFSLLGPSGSGKTTLLRLIAGFEAASAGKILLGGADVTNVPANRRDVNTVFQNYALFPHMTVAENIAYPLDVKKVPSSEIRRRVGEQLEKVEMGKFGARLPHELSGGQRQRIALARALVGRPKVLLLDEPLGALDLRLRQQMQLVLVHLQKEVAITFIYVTHDQSEALTMSDRMAVLSEGRILQIGSPREMYSKPRSRFVAGFLGRCNIVEGTIGGGKFGSAGGDFNLNVTGQRTNGPAAIALRAEDITVRSAGAEPTSSDRIVLAGIIEDTMFLGEGTEYRVRCGGLVFKAMDFRRGIEGFRAGASVDLSFAPENAVILDE
jgi:spermidine/putrescine transport system ATP-binding protein